MRLQQENGRNGTVAKHQWEKRQRKHRVSLTPIAAALGLFFFAGGIAPAEAAPGGAAWFAASNAGKQARAAQRGPMPGAAALPSAARQQAQARQQLSRSIANLNRTAAAIAAQQAAQESARANPQNADWVRDGLGQDGLDRLAGGRWDAAAPETEVKDGRQQVTIAQNKARAILEWNSFHVGRNTDLTFKQASTDAVLNKVMGDVRPSQIQGSIRADGTVMIANQNGVVFTGSSQVNVRNLVAAAAKITDAQFENGGLYVDANGTQPTFTEALGKVEIQAGAIISTHRPGPATQGGGYVLMLGNEVDNAGQISTPRGQTVLAAGDRFYIRRGVGTDGNQASTTRGNEVAAHRDAESVAGKVSNSGLITATEGDITLTGHEVTQAGVAIATTSQATRGTIHLSNRANNEAGRVTLAQGSTTAILLDETDATALDGQRDAALEKLTGNNAGGNSLATGNFNNLSTLADRGDLSRVEIVSGNTVEFQGDSLTLATGGQITVSAARRTLVNERAELDVAGAIGVRVAMDSNNLQINVQGNEQRDAPVNRESGQLNSSNIWVDRRSLIHVPADYDEQSNPYGYKTDRWYTAGGLLEVSGYLATNGHTLGEWMAQGGTVTVSGGDFVTRAGSNVNLSGGTLDVQDGYIRQSWLRGADGRLYEVSRAPGDVLYTGLYNGYEITSERWGHTRRYYSPLIGPSRRWEAGYTVGRDAGKLVVATNSAVLEGDITSEVYQGPRQTQAPQPGLDGYYQSQTAAARRGRLVIGNYVARYDAETGMLRHELSAVLDSVALDERSESLADSLELDDVIASERTGKLVLDAATLNDFNLGALRIGARNSIVVDHDIEVEAGGEIILYGPQIEINADVTAHSGTVHAGNVLNQWTSQNSGSFQDTTIAAPEGTSASVRVKDGAKLDASGLWSNLLLDPSSTGALPYRNGGRVSLRGSADITLEPGSVIDVSSGAGVAVDGGRLSGRGGNVTLQTGQGSAPAQDGGTLVLDGTLIGYGVDGGGTLILQSGGTVVAGGQALQTDGYLAAGERAPISLALGEPITIKAGDTLPLAATYTNIFGGQVLGSSITFTNTGHTLNIVVGEGGWDLAGTDLVIYVNGSNSAANRYRGIDASKSLIPEGTVITRISSGTLPVGYTLTTAVQDIPTPAYTVAGGQQAVQDTVISAGTLLAAGTTLGQRIAVRKPLTLRPEFFQTGFSHYDVTGKQGLLVAEDSRIDVTMPIYRATSDALNVATGSTTSQALEVWTPPLFLQNPQDALLSQRAGASVTLGAGSSRSGLNDMTTVQAVVGSGAVLVVDPRQSIVIESVGQLTVDGTLRAPGGEIALRARQGVNEISDVSVRNALAQGHSRSIWVGSTATLDVAGYAGTARDLSGRRYGQVVDGGSILLGGRIDHEAGLAIAPHLFVVVQEGALLDASGVHTELDVPGAGPTTVASHGGRISLASNNGIYLEGAVKAEAGGAGAAGGTLEIGLEAPEYWAAMASDRVRRPRELIVSQGRREGMLSGPATPDDTADLLEYGSAKISVDHLQQGGFDNLSLFVNGIMSFDGNVRIEQGQSLSLYAGSYGLAQGVTGSPSVQFSAPYVRMAGPTQVGVENSNWIRPTIIGGSSNQPVQGALTVRASLIDFRDEMTIGANGTLAQAGESVVVDRAGFELNTFESQGDVRFLKHVASGSGRLTAFDAAGDVLFRAAQLYPSTHAVARVRAGFSNSEDGGAYDSARTLRVERVSDDVPLVPLSVFGQLTLGAATIEQSGIVRAPLGLVTLGTLQSVGATEKVVLAPQSITSASAAGLILPYGGTVDDETYIYAGQEVSYLGATGTAMSGDTRGVVLAGQVLDVQGGALIDLSGGGDLLGAGFVSGRGGSTDARFNPLVQNRQGGFTLPGLATNPVYAIVPGVQPGMAPVAPEGGAVDPIIGQQITVGAGVPGLPPGTYTLLPSTYALLPGAFRVEINGSANRPITSTSVAGARAAYALRNGSWTTTGQLSIANTHIADSLAKQIILTSADVLRNYSDYNETSYAEFAMADAAKLGVPHPLLPADAMPLTLKLEPGGEGEAFRMNGRADFRPAEGGRAGTAIVLAGDGSQGSLEIVANSSTPGFDGASVQADALSALAAPRLVVGATPIVTYGQSGNFIEFSGGASAVYLREGANLSAAEVLLTARGESTDGIVVEPGASIDTVGHGRPGFDSRDGFIYMPGRRSVLAVSNGWLQVLPPDANDSTFAASPVRIGGCIGADCIANTHLYSEGTIAIATDNTFQLGSDVRYGTENLILAVGAVNIGESDLLQALDEQDRLPAGLILNQGLLDRLLLGDTEYNVPALKTLTLTVRDSVNFYGTTGLRTRDSSTGESSLESLVLATPAIYGYGEASDVALIETDHLVWQGATNAPGAIIVDGAGTGSGSLDIRADRITFGYGPYAQPNVSDNPQRITVGFADVNLTASDRVTANHQGNFSVYQAQGAFVDGEGVEYTGGNLNILTPLITGEAGSISRIQAGGVVTLSALESAATGSGSPTEALGAELVISGEQIILDTAVALPSGKLALQAERELRLTDLAQIDMSGRAVQFDDVTQYSWGGDVTLESQHGSIYQAAASSIDLSAEHNQAGLLTAIALGDDAGTVDLQGDIRGTASGYYDAGGTVVPYKAGGVEIRARRLSEGGVLNGDFAALNQRLNTGGVTGSRSFQLKQGDLTIGDDVRAGEVNVSLDAGHLTIVGKIDASGERVGSIRLAGNSGLTVASGAELDVHGRVLRVDSYGKIIDAPNRAIVELNSGEGILTLAPGSRIDLRHGTDAALGTGASEHDGIPRGTLELNAPRVGSNGRYDDADAETFGDVAVDATGPVDIQGARSIAVNATYRYDDAPVADDPFTDGGTYQYIDQAYLQGKHEQSQTFINEALKNNTLLVTKLAGLNNGTYRDVFHLRPGLEIVSNATVNPEGRIVVRGDIDLSGYRYASLNPLFTQTAVRGSGEPGALAIRAEGGLDIYGSITDGFAPPPDTAEIDGNGWLLISGEQPFGGDLIVPSTGVQLEAGTEFLAGKVLNYDLPIQAFSLPAGFELPTQAVLDASITLPANTTLYAAIRHADGTVWLPAGTILAEAVSLPAGTMLDGGTRLPNVARLAPMVWPEGRALPVAVQLAEKLALRVGSLIPSDTKVVLPDDAVSVPLRAQDGSAQGKNWALAPMLEEGALSWGMRLVAGADISAADPRTTLTSRADDLTFSDSHYRLREEYEAGGGMVWTPESPFEAGAPVPDYLLVLCTSFPYYCEAGGGEGGLTGYFAQDLLPSVVRTGTGDLEIFAAGSVTMSSPFGLYTAGGASADIGPGYQQERGALGSDGSVLGPDGSAMEHLVNTGSIYQANYPTHGGNVVLRAGRDLVGDNMGQRIGPFPSDRVQQSGTAVGNWLWRQGTGDTAGVDAIPTAWWINFGTYATEPYSGSVEPDARLPYFVGFVGVGTLGGGNLTVDVGANLGIGQVQRVNRPNNRPRSEGLAIVVASTGRMLDRADPLLTGGGDLTLRIGGRANRGLLEGNKVLSGANTGNEFHSLNSVVVNLRGSVNVMAGIIGNINTIYGSDDRYYDSSEVRPYDPFVPSRAIASGGLLLAPGDSTFNVNSRGDLVVGGAIDPGRVKIQNSTPYQLLDGGLVGGGGQTWFSLWTANTALNLLSAGGNLTPITWNASRERPNVEAGDDTSPTDGSFVYPSSMTAVAASGNIYYGGSASTWGSSVVNFEPYGILLAPSNNLDARLDLLAGDSIYAGGAWVARSGASPNAVPTPLNPAFIGRDSLGTEVASNLNGYGLAANATGRFPLIAKGPNTVSSSTPQYRQPVRVYALDGDIIGVATGAVYRFGGTGNVLNGQTWYVGANPVRMMAGRDIVKSGLELGESRSIPGEVAGQGTSAGTFATNFLYHNDSNDVSVVQAGRDILYSSFDVAGPGVLEIMAGRDIRMEDRASVRSLGAVVPGDGRLGASIVMQAGYANVGSENFSDFLDAYLDPDNLADPARPLADQPGKVVTAYSGQLTLADWLRAEYGYAGEDDGAQTYLQTKQDEIDAQRGSGSTAPRRDLRRDFERAGSVYLVNWLSSRFDDFDPSSDARAYLAALPADLQRDYARQIYFAELRAGGREYNDADGPRFGSYLRGRNVIAALFPENNAQGEPISYDGDIVMYGNSGVQTLFGGDVQMLTPGGGQTFGVEGANPASTAGVITQGQGNIQLYSRDSILLGQSRIMTTFGGDILAWSAEGDINAGRGAKTTVVYTPPRRVYDDFGNVTLAPQVPSTGAGIATDAPIAEVPPGDLDLIAPLGTIDAGEAGIRFSGNANFAALQVVNAANIVGQGEVTGIPVVAAVNIGALTNASSASTAAATSAQEAVARARAESRQNLPSIISVQILGFGDEGSSAPANPEPRVQAPAPVKYNPNAPVQIIGNGRLTDTARVKLTARERASLD